MDIDSGYWQVVTDEKEREILELFVPDRNRQWKVIPTGELNPAPIFVAMMMKLQMEWDTLSKERGIKMSHQK